MPRRTQKEDRKVIRTLIVDDETLLRVTLRSLIDWERRGYTVVADCVGGAQALTTCKSHTVDLLITDVKMPGMSGLELLDRLRRGSHMPVSVVLSGYNEFRAGARGVPPGRLRLPAQGRSERTEPGPPAGRPAPKRSSPTPRPPPPKSGAGQQPAELAPGDYAAVVFSVDDFARQAARFGPDLREKLEKPMLELARQIPRLSGRATIQGGVSLPVRAVLPGAGQAAFQGTITSVIRRLQAVWRDYMNLSVLAAVSGAVPAAECPGRSASATPCSSSRCCTARARCAPSGRPGRWPRPMPRRRRPAMG